MRLAVVLALVFAIFTIHGTAEACSCLRPEGPREELAKFTAVFEGRVASIARDDARLRVTLEVQRAWKGLDAPTIVVTTADNSAACGFNFVEGESYLLYADEVEGELMVGICSRSREIAGATEDLEALGAASYQPGDFPPPLPSPEPESPAGPAAPAPAVPIEPPPPPPPAKSGGCAGCSASPTSDAGLFGLLLLVLPLLRRRVVS